MEKEITGIKSWAEDDRPREKLMLKGKHALSDSELLAILIRTGTREESAVDVAKEILNSVKGDISELSRMTVQELARFKGMGEVKAITIIAALELGRRRRNSDKEKPKRDKITTSRDAAHLILDQLSDLRHEEFWLLFLNRANEVTGKQNLSIGGMSGTIVDPKIVFKMAVDKSAHNIILVHNHPSGNLKPSEQDIKLTKKLKEAGTMLELPILDHIIIAGDEYFSFADEGMI